MKQMQIVLLLALSLLAGATTRAAQHSAFMPPVQSVFDQYIKIQTALASDSLSGVPDDATALARSVRQDRMKMLPPKVAEQAEALARANNLPAARAAFKPLSQSLVQYLKAHHLTDSKYAEVYCPMARASWLQTGAEVSNPYMGKAMLRCGQFVQQKNSGHSGHSTHNHSGH